MRLCLRRREFIAGLGGAATWPLAAGAQRRDLPVIGFLSSASVGAQATAVPAAFRKGLSQTGFVPGQNVIIETRQAEGHYEMLAALAHDLIRIPVKVIVAAGGAVSARAAIEATKTIPVLFIAGFDPVKIGFVSSFNRPGGNATGVSIYTTELLAKRLQLLRELVPRHRHKKFERGGMAETPRTAARSGANGNHHGRTREPGQPQYRGHIERETGCCAWPRT